MATQLSFGLPAGAEKLKAVKELVDDLTEDLDNEQFLPDDRALALEKLKIYTRDPKNSEPLYTEKGIHMLLRHAYDNSSIKASHAAMRVLANAMLLVPLTRRIFVEKKFAPRACQKLDTEDFDGEFLNSRVLLISTYDPHIDLDELLDNEKLADRIINNLARHEKEMNSKKAESDPMQDMALAETLKLLFNVTHHRPEKASMFTPAVPHLAALLFKDDISPTNPLSPPVGFIVNGFLNLELGGQESQESLHPEGDTDKVVFRLIEILDPAIRTTPDSQLDASVTPLIGLIKTIYEHAPESSKNLIRERLLPTEEDRKDVLGKGDNLSAKLLKNYNNPLAPNTRNMIQHLFFDLSDKDASKFVENVGYGLASGFLFQNNIPVPASATGDSEETKSSRKPTNPITGQFIEDEKSVEMPEMTEDEKEREAERLFVLFERLKATGVVDIQNPVEAAAREGRYRELKEDEVEELE
ncbi:hypothetical protein FGRMN_7589 [Fusarium graminum]|nr:hypothetical protein FGRMN_7589 [Fusarium graminum]